MTNPQTNRQLFEAGRHFIYAGLHLYLDGECLILMPGHFPYANAMNITEEGFEAVHYFFDKPVSAEIKFKDCKFFQDK